MTIKLYNTLTRKKEAIKPFFDDSVSMYVCGPTVYGHPHIGNARAAIVPDILYRLLMSKYKSVKYIRNITDVDDKIIDASKQEGISIDKITLKYTKIYHDNMADLGNIEPTHEPKVTDTISKIISSIEKIIKNGNAYVKDSHVLFDTDSFKEYGVLSGKKLGEMLDGVRIDNASYKKSSKDFILWKPSEDGSPGWDSPWGKGRPGWHIECTSMIKDILGDDTTLDIHGGGNDLIFPHHENEIAQGSCISKEKYCNHWFHNGIVLVEKKKMSKSLGNVILLDDLLRKHSRSVIRLALLSAHYRQPLNWSNQTLNNAKNLYKKLVSVIDLEDGFQPVIHDEHDSYSQCSEIQDILSDDLNTPEAINYLSRLSKTARNDAEDRTKLIHSMKFIGLAPFIEKSIKPFLNEEKIEHLIQKRNEYRIKKDFKNADAVRDKLLAMGVELKDSDDNTTWNYSQD